jgi:hypothetical protein
LSGFASVRTSDHFGGGGLTLDTFAEALPFLVDQLRAEQRAKTVAARAAEPDEGGASRGSAEQVAKLEEDKRRAVDELVRIALQASQALERAKEAAASATQRALAAEARAEAAEARSKAMEQHWRTAFGAWLRFLNPSEGHGGSR